MFQSVVGAMAAVLVAEKPKKVQTHAVANGVIYGIMSGLTTNR